MGFERAPAARPGGLALTLAVALTGLALASSAAAAEGAPPLRPDAEVTRRLAFLEGRLERGDRAANLWWNAWIYGWTGLTLAQAGIALGTTDRGLRIDAAVGAAASSLGVLPLGVLPFPARRAAGLLRALPEATPEERRCKLARAERLLRQSAEVEALNRSWVNHAVGDSVSLGVGLVLALVYQRPLGSAVFSAAGGVALNTLQIFTQPTQAIDDLRDYERGLGGGFPGHAAFGPSTPRASWSLAPSPFGIGITGHF